MKCWLPFVVAFSLLSTVLATPTGETWVRNTSPGPGHISNPGPWGDGQGSDRSEWISFFKTSPVNPAFMLVGADLGRAYFTNTALGGSEFVPVDVPIYRTSTASFHPLDSATAYLLLEEREAPGTGGWWRTTDEGVTWEQILDTTATPVGKNLLVVDPSNPAHLFVGTISDGLMRSIDHGATWQTVAFAGASILTLEIAADGSSLYLIPGSQIWEDPSPSNRATRGGSLWRIDTDASGDLDPSTLTMVQDASTFSEGNFFDLDTNPLDGTKGMLICVENLMFFSNRGDTIDTNTYIGGNLSYAKYNPNNADHLILAGRGAVSWWRVFQWSEDGGQTWHHWTHDGSYVMNVRDFAPSNWRSFNHHYAHQNPKMGCTIDLMEARHLIDFVGGDPASVVMWSTNWNKGPLRSDDYGANFAPFAHGGGFKQAAQMDYGLSAEKIAVGRKEYGVQLSEDGGLSWKAYNVQTTPEFPIHINGARAFEYKSCWGVAFDPTNDETLLAVLNYNPAWIMRTEDFGDTWSKVGELTFSFTGSIYDDGRVLWSDADPNYVYVSTRRSQDGGRTFPTTLAHPVAAVHPHNAAVLVSKETPNSWWLSVDYGDTWTPISVANLGTALDGGSRPINASAHRNVAIDPRPEHGPHLGNPLRFLIGGEGGVWEFLADDASGATGTWSLLPGSAAALVADPFLSTLNDPTKPVWLGYVIFNPNPGFTHEVYALPERPHSNKDRGEALYQQIYRSQDYGVTWEHLADPVDFPGNLPNYFWTKAAAISPQNDFSFQDYAGMYTLEQPLGHLSAVTEAQNKAVHNLTTGNYQDWCFFGWSSSQLQTRKAGVNLIGDFQVIGNGTLTTKRYSTSSTYPWDRFTFTDGDSPISLQKKTACINVDGTSGEGLSIAVPADLTPRRVTIWTSGWQSEATLRASLSDGSAVDYLVTVTPNNPANNFHMYRHVIEYHAGQPNETLILEFVKDHDIDGETGNVKFNAITLEEL